jgi:hypothetical protein
MEATDWIAGYAAVVATAAFGWEVWKTIRARRPPVEVKLSNALLTFLPDPPWAAMVNVLNHGSQPIRVNSAGFNFQDGSGQTVVIMQPPPRATIPGVVEPGDAGQTWLLLDELGPLDPFRPLVAWASLATGQRIDSKPFTLRSR